MNEILKKLKKHEVQIRKAINTRMQGDFHSVFKGTGLEFAEVRDYQYGDDVRAIDWNVSAKGHGTFVKNFKEEKEQTVFFILDVSASQDIGKVNQKKVDIGKEICGVLTLSAVKESGHVGLICFTNQKELYLKPDKGPKHGYNLILKLFDLTPKSLKTDLNKALNFTMSLLKRKSIVILISDFIDEGYEHSLTALARKHNLVVIHLSDLREINFPSLGIIPLFDKESKKTIWVNSSSDDFRQTVSQAFRNNQDALEKLCRKHRANYLWIDTKEDYIPKLIKLFNVKNKGKGA